MEQRALVVVLEVGGVVQVDALGRSSAKCWVDYASDVTENDLRLAVRENFAAVEHLKPLRVVSW